MKSTQAVEPEDPGKRKNTGIHVRLPKEFLPVWRKAIEMTGGDEPFVVRNLAEAFCDYVESHGNITFPLQILPIDARERVPHSTGAPSETSFDQESGSKEWWQDLLRRHKEMAEQIDRLLKAPRPAKEEFVAILEKQRAEKAWKAADSKLTAEEKSTMAAEGGSQKPHVSSSPAAGATLADDMTEDILAKQEGKTRKRKPSK